jgi:hypothetical protein
MQPARLLKVATSCGSSRTSTAYTSGRPWHYPCDVSFVGIQKASYRIMETSTSDFKGKQVMCDRVRIPAKKPQTEQCMMELWVWSLSCSELTRNSELPGTRYTYWGELQAVHKTCLRVTWVATNKTARAGLPIPLGAYILPLCTLNLRHGVVGFNVCPDGFWS